jgi:hypothetical protein
VVLIRPIADTVELTINLLINAIAAALKRRYGYKVYARELRQGFKDPCFFIEVLPSRGRRTGYRRLERLQVFCIHFFPKGFDKLTKMDEVIYLDEEPRANPSPSESDRDFEMEVYTVAEELYGLLELVEVSDRVFNGSTIKCKGSGMGYSISEGVLHFNVNFSYHLLEEKIDPYMEALIQTTLPKPIKG